MKRLQYPLNEFWVSVPYSKKYKTLGLGTILSPGRSAEVVSPHVGEIVEIIKKDKGYEVWGKYTDRESITYISVYPLDEVSELGKIIQNEVMGFTSANHIYVKTIVTKEDAKNPSLIRRGFRDPLGCLYRYMHQENSGNIPYCTPRINHIKTGR